MSATYRACDRSHWASAMPSLKDYGDYSDRIEYVNQREDYCDSMSGEWWYACDDTLTVYSGTFANDHSPGADTYTYAEVFEFKEAYHIRVKEWESKDEYLPTEEQAGYLGDVEQE